MSEEKIIVVPQADLLDAIVQMDEYAKTSYNTLMSTTSDSSRLEDYSDVNSLFAALCEFYVGTLRTKEVLLDLITKEVDSQGAQVPENSIVVTDEDYVLATSLMTGLLLIERQLLTQNVSLKQH